MTGAIDWRWTGNDAEVRYAACDFHSFKRDLRDSHVFPSGVDLGLLKPAVHYIMTNWLVDTIDCEFIEEVGRCTVGAHAYINVGGVWSVAVETAQVGIIVALSKCGEHFLGI